MMDEVVDLLIKRMESNPEEFCDGWDPEGDSTLYGAEYQPLKWRHIIYQMRSRVGDTTLNRVGSNIHKPLPFLSDEQVKQLYDKYIEIQAQEFEKYVLRTLLHVEDKSRYDAKVVPTPSLPTRLRSASLGADMQPMQPMQPVQHTYNALTPGEWVEST